MTYFNSSNSSFGNKIGENSTSILEPFKTVWVKALLKNKLVVPPGKALFINKSTQEQHSIYDVELVKDCDDLIETVNEDGLKKLAFVSFTINDDYQPTLIKRVTTSETFNKKEKQQIIQSVMPVLRGFMSAISD